MKAWIALALGLIAGGPAFGRPEAAQPVPFEVHTGQRQLFLDDHGIDRVEHLERVVHAPVKRGPVIRPDRPWESSLQIRSMPAWDTAAQRFKLWMITSTTIPGVAEMTYAESADGFRWTKPMLRQKALLDSLENNIVTLDPAREWGANAIENVVYDPADPDPERRFKGFANVYSREPIVSPDGIQWTKLNVPALPSQDESNLCYDPLKKLFIATLKSSGPFGRAHAIWTSTNFDDWTDTGVLFHADERDQELGQAHMAARLADPALHHSPGLDPAACKVDVYNLGITRYEGLYVGFPALFHSSGEGGFHLIQLSASRDLTNWERVGDRATFIGPSEATPEHYDWTQILPPTGPLVRGDELWFYYTGIRYRVPPEGATDNGAVCLAVLRRDGFVSLDAGDTPGTVETQAFTLTGKTLSVNVDAAEGELRAAVLALDGTVLAESEPLTGDQPRGTLQWEHGDLASLEGTTIQLRFTLKKGALYSYWLEE